MRQVLGVWEVRELDRRTIEETGIPGRLLMEVAGFGAFMLLREQLASLPPRDPVLVLAGKGNNAGDGFVVARYLASEGVPVRVLCVGDPLRKGAGGDACENARLLPAFGVALETWSRKLQEEAFHGGVSAVVDALLGTGLRGDLRAPYDLLVADLNAAGRPVLSLDIPTGLCGDSGRILGCAVKADWTATFGAVKLGMTRGEGPRLCGEIRLVPLPFPPAPPAPGS